MFTDGRTDGQTPDQPVHYKLTLSGELKNRFANVEAYIMSLKFSKFPRFDINFS